MLEAVSADTGTYDEETRTLDTAPGAGLARFRAVPVMATLDEPDLRDLWARSVGREHGPGEIIRVQGDPADHLLVLLTGRVAAAHLTRAGRSVALDDLVAPCALDKVAVIDGRGHAATLTAVTRCAVAAVPARRFLAAVEALPEARAHVLRTLAAQSRAQQARLVLATLPRGRHRVAWWLAEQVRDAPAGGRALVRPPGSQARLGELLGLTRVTVNRALKGLEREGVIRATAEGIEVVDVERLLGSL